MAINIPESFKIRMKYVEKYFPFRLKFILKLLKTYKSIKSKYSA